MSGCRDNQEVGLEAATLERVRNSSLVKCSGADNVAGLSAAPKPWDSISSEMGSVGERSIRREGRLERRLERMEVRMPV
jgi:hypothetical protein